MNFGDASRKCRDLATLPSLWRNVTIYRSEMHTLTNQHIRYFGYMSDEIKCLDMEGTLMFDTRVQNPNIHDILHSLSNLTELDVSSSRVIRRLAFLNGMPNLKKLVLDRAYTLDLKSIPLDLPYMPALNFFSCEHNWRFTRRLFIWMCSRMPALVTLRCRYGIMLQPKDGRCIMRHCPKIKKFLFSTMFNFHMGRDWMNFVYEEYPDIVYTEECLNWMEMFYEHAAHRYI